MNRLSDQKNKPSFFRSRRVLLLVLVLLLILVILPGILLFVQRNNAMDVPQKGTPVPNNLAPVQYVNPFIGTGTRPEDAALGGFAGGNVVPGANYPHGMVQWSPDTTNAPGM